MGEPLLDRLNAMAEVWGEEIPEYKEAADRIAELEAAGRRLLPAEGYITDDMPDRQLVALDTSVGALRQLVRALAPSPRPVHGREGT